MKPSHYKLEVCIDTPAGLHACQKGVDTIELCSALAVGGLTPTAGMVALAQSSTVPVHAMIRPRAGNFTYSPQEVEAALIDIASVKAAQLSGIVIGAATADRTLDLPILKEMVHAADGLTCTLHRVIDTLEDPYHALEQAIDLGFSRILTSGGQLNVQAGADCLQKLEARARGRIEIIAGSGVNALNLEALARKTGLHSFHASCSRGIVQDETTVAFGFGPNSMNISDPEKIMHLRGILDAIK